LKGHKVQGQVSKKVSQKGQKTIKVKVKRVKVREVKISIFKVKAELEVVGRRD
jgi:hypothetical protein